VAHPVRGALRLAVSATLIAALVVAAVLTLTGNSVTPAQATTRIDGPAVAAAPLLPTPAFPDLDFPDVPLPRSTQASEQAVVYTCEPSADARMDDPAHPNWITNKDCPKLNALKERAQREYRDQLARESEEEVGDWRERACSDPSSSVYGTATCGGDVDGNGLLDGTSRSTLPD
jgi:hypothetical protein